MDENKEIKEFLLMGTSIRYVFYNSEYYFSGRDLNKIFKIPDLNSSIRDNCIPEFTIKIKAESSDSKILREQVFINSSNVFSILSSGILRKRFNQNHIKNMIFSFVIGFSKFESTVSNSLQSLTSEALLLEKSSSVYSCPIADVVKSVYDFNLANFDDFTDFKGYFWSVLGKKDSISTTDVFFLKKILGDWKSKNPFLFINYRDKTTKDNPEQIFYFYKNTNVYMEAEGFLKFISYVKDNRESLVAEYPPYYLYSIQNLIKATSNG